MPASTNLESTWTTLYTQTLPSLARAKAPSQPYWPVHLDHCFARIILDAVIGAPTPASPATPWTARLKSPAVKNMTIQQLEKCIEIGEGVKSGRENLVKLDQQSLNARGKTKAGGGKRKKIASADEAKGAAISSKRSKTANKENDRNSNTQPSILTTMGLPTPSASKSSSSSSSSSSTSPLPAAATAAAAIPDDLRDLITKSGLTEFRQRVLLCLCQIPEGYYSTYLALSNHLASAPRAVGNALRNNPFAPRVP